MTLPLRIMIVDDHEVVRNGIKALLEEESDITVAAEAGGVKEAIERAEWARPDVVVMDVRLADGSGIEATREIRTRLPKTQVLMLTTFADDEALLASIAGGKTNRQIGDELHLAEKTVKNYVSSILSKLEVARRAEAAAYLARHTSTPGSA